MAMDEKIRVKAEAGYSAATGNPHNRMEHT